VRIGEPGINDPQMKLLVTGINFFLLWVLQENGFIDPSESARAQDVTADSLDVNLPLKSVCESQARFGLGIVIFAAITVICLGGVIFGTSTQTLSEIKIELKCCGKAAGEITQAAKVNPAETASTASSTLPPLRTSPSKPDPEPCRASNRLRRSSSCSTVTFASNDATLRASIRKDLQRAKLCLFFTYLLIVFVLMLIFAFVPFYSDDNGGATRIETGWRKACDDNDIDTLDKYGLS
jgi:hypothetical protein